MRAAMFGACLAWFASVFGAAAAVAAQGIEGRWQTHTRDLVLDISPCGERFCGQAVNSDNQCERTILVVAINAASRTFDGELTVRSRAKPYKVKVSLVIDAKPAVASMVIVGDDVEPSLFRRTFPFRAMLARTGEPTCPPRPVS